MKFELPELNYSYADLEPHIDTMTMEIHYSKHHATYVKNLNTTLENYPELQDKSLEELLSNIESLPKEIQKAVRNNGGGHYNHSFFWSILAPHSNLNLTSKLNELLVASFGSFDKFKEEFTKAALGRFGSGWAWLILTPSNKLEIISTGNQKNLLTENIKAKPIMCIDVWEHAYYLKYQNRRADYIAAFWNVVNWEQAEKNLLA